jgi:hypothetical protein
MDVMNALVKDAKTTLKKIIGFNSLPYYVNW